ncbi:hypothetical protein CEXT_790621 [Caerostris extrusa]|uniref:Uncharacterized protein n=1 Tax=Caerostris extrusa TaxID=172846 RepID=A0AAV4PNR4_CAEEX|nr:hypothetical protein CEXT_790621 [Caerostris extrusa]
MIYPHSGPNEFRKTHILILKAPLFETVLPGNRTEEVMTNTKETEKEKKTQFADESIEPHLYRLSRL